MKELIIDREKWYRGKTGAFSCLRRKQEDHRQCCLGFYALACGLSFQEITNKAGPEELLYEVHHYPEEMEWLVNRQNTDLASEDNEKLQRVNDAYEYDDSIFRDTITDIETERERMITEIFAKHDVQVKFIN